MNKTLMLKQKYEESSAHLLYAATCSSSLFANVVISVESIDKFYTRNKYTPISGISVKVFFKGTNYGIAVVVNDSALCKYKLYSLTSHTEIPSCSQNKMSKLITAVSKALRAEKRKYDIAKLKQHKRGDVLNHINVELNACDAKVTNLDVITDSSHRYVMDIDTNKTKTSNSNLITLVATKKLDAFKISNLVKDLELTFDEIKDLLKVLIKAKRRNTLIERLDAL